MLSEKREYNSYLKCAYPESANWHTHTITIPHNYILLYNDCRATAVNWLTPCNFLLLLSLKELTTSCVSSDKLCKDMATGDWLNNPPQPLSQPSSSLHPTSRANSLILKDGLQVKTVLLSLSPSPALCLPLFSFYLSPCFVFNFFSTTVQWV